MNIDFIAERIAQLRTAKGVSARDMSLTMGQADNYINHIENKRSLPSISSFFYICEYLKVTPYEFFDEGNRNPKELNDLISKMKKLNDQSLSHITGIVDELLRKK
jgi:transcriptional regulator with XRE-family HTH domain